MAFWRSLLTGSPDPLLSAAIEGPKFDVVGDDWSDDVRTAFGLTATSDAWTAVPPPVSRKTAMSVPAVKRSRDLICNALAGLPLDQIGPDKIHRSNALLTQPEASRTRENTMASTVEDLLFEARAFWRVTSRDFARFPVQVERVHPSRVQVSEFDGMCVRPDCSGRVTMNGKHVHDGDVIIFEAPTDGLLTAGARAIRTALALDSAAARYADEPVPLGFLTPTGDADPTPEEAQAALDSYHAARQKRVTGYVGAGLKHESSAFNAEQIQLADARQHATLEISRLTGIDPEDLGVSTTSRTYQNSQDRRKALLDFVIAPYMRAIEGRLSLGDVTPRGSVVRFNLSAFLRSDDASRYAAYILALQAKAITFEEIRELEDRPPLTAEQIAAPIPTREPVAA